MLKKELKDCVIEDETITEKYRQYYDNTYTDIYVS